MQFLVISSNLGSELYNFCLTVYYMLRVSWKCVELLCNVLYCIINHLVPMLRTLFSYVPGLLRVVYVILNISFNFFNCCFSIAVFVSAPIISSTGFLLQLVLPAKVSADFRSLVYFVASWFSFATIYVVSILLIVMGSLVVATEERSARRNYLRPKTSVPLLCLGAGLALHYDKVQSNDWVSPVALFTGACWYCMSLIYDDLEGRRQHQAQSSGLARAMAGAVNRTSLLNSVSVPSIPEPHGKQATPMKLRRRRVSGGTKPATASLSKREEAVAAGEKDRPLYPYPAADLDRLCSIDDETLLVMPDTVCPICIEDYLPDEAIRAVACCAHTFHNDCLSQWLSKSPKCPMCRAPQTSFGQMVHFLFE